jgi:hypothetical protein
MDFNQPTVYNFMLIKKKKKKKKKRSPIHQALSYAEYVLGCGWMGTPIPGLDCLLQVIGGVALGFTLQHEPIKQ